MKNLLIILISILLLSSPVIGDNHKGETLYGWGECCDYKWMGFGDKDTHPVYKGQVENGKPNGLGVLNVPNVLKYVGEFIYGKPEGQGTVTLPDGRKYIGEWKDGLSHGQVTSPDGWRYVGELKNWKFHGQGTFTFSWGDKYVGKWKNGLPWNGTDYDKNGKIYRKIVNGKSVYQ